MILLRVKHLLQIIIIFSIFVNINLPVFAAGKVQKTKMEQVDALIEKKDYNEAIRLLTDLIREDDELFDEYQKKLRFVINKLDNYTVVANILFDLVRDRPEDLQTIIRMSNELAATNAARDPTTAHFIATIEQLARLSANNRTRDRILKEGRDLLDQNQYLAAMRLYQGGFQLYQDLMYRDPFENSVKNRTRENLSTANNLIVELPNVINNFSTTGISVNATEKIARESGSFVTFYNNLIPQMERLTSIKSFIGGMGDFWVAEREKNIAATSDYEGRYFFAMAPAFITGRPQDKQWIDPTIVKEEDRTSLPYRREGMLGALDSIWNAAVVPLEQSFTVVSNDMYQNSVREAGLGNYAESLSYANNAIEFNKTPLALISRWRDFTDPDREQAQNLLGQQVPANRVDDFLHYRSMNASIAHLQQAGNLGTRFRQQLSRMEGRDVLAEWKSGSITETQALSAETGTRNLYKEISGGAMAEITLNSRDAEQFRQLPASDTSSSYFRNSQSVLEDLINRINIEDLASASRVYTLTDSILEEKLAKLEKSYNDGATLAAGMPLELENGENVNAKYPREALYEWSSTEKEFSTAINQARAAIASHNSEPARVSTNSTITRLRTEITAISQRLNQLQANEIASAATARANVQRAENFENQGKNSIAQARAFLLNNNFDEAYNQVERASTNYNASLDLQENPELRKALMEVIVPLNVEITIAERIYVERQVENIVNNARNTYFDNNFDSAERQLVSAEEIWAKVSTESHIELEYWLTIVRGALTLRSGRTIPVTAPLYPVMSQLLSAAEKSYQEGVKLLAQERSAGEEMLAIARAKTQEVRLMFPVNQDASILELRIDQVLDPQNFALNFQQRFVTAVSGARRGLFQSYADLQDLAAINPNYQGMRAAIIQAEIDVGIRPPPIDTRLIRRSDELLAAAQRLFRGGNRSMYTSVLDNVNEALRLNPNNVLASQFKDQVTTAMGTSAVSADDILTEQEYIRAVTALQNGQKILAISIVERLMQMPKNRNSVRIKNLRQRIEASM